MGKPHPRERPKSGRASGKWDKRQRDDDHIQLFGLHAVDAALRNSARPVLSLTITENAQRKLQNALATRRALPTPEIATPKKLDKILGPDTVHQGVLMETEPLIEPSLDECAHVAKTGAPIVILDQVTDPHNVGAVLRSAAVFGASALILTRRNSPPLGGVLAKSASGALELIPVHLAQNLSRTLAGLKERGIEVIGLDGEADTAIEDIPFNTPTAIVLGAEGKGLRQLTRETCDTLCRIAPAGQLASLNVSNAAAVALHLAAMRRRS